MGLTTAAGQEPLDGAVISAPGQASLWCGVGFCGSEENPGDNRGVFSQPRATMVVGAGWGGGEASVFSSIPPVGDRVGAPHAGKARSGPSALAPGPALLSSQKCTSEWSPWCRGVGEDTKEPSRGVGPSPG